MSACPQCGSPMAEGSLFCGVCGHSANKPAPGGKPGVNKMTMIGVASPLASMPAAQPPAQPPQAPADRKQELAKKTMLGIAPVQLPPQAAPLSQAEPASQAAPSQAAPSQAAPSQGWGGRTMLGVASPAEVLAQAAGKGSTRPMDPLPPSSAAPGAAPPPSAAAPIDPARAASHKGRTIVGMAAPDLSQLAPPSAAAPSTGAPSTGAPNAGAPNAKRTLLGMAPIGLAGPAPAQPGASAPPPAHGKGKTLLGIASPLAGLSQQPGPGGAQPSARKTLMGAAFANLVAPLVPTVTEPEYVEEFYEEVEPQTGEVQRRVRMVAKPLPPLHRRPAFYALVGAILLLGSGVTAALMIKGPPPVTAETRLDGEGRDVLHVVCKSCPDGTRLTHDSASGEVKNGEGEVRLSSRMKVGENTVALAIDRPGTGRDETVTLKVPVAYRFATDLAALQEPTPAVRVDVEATAGAQVTVQGKAVALDAGGKASVKIDVQAELTALAGDAKTFERDIPYTVVSGGNTSSGKLSVRVGVVPLHIDSPGRNMVTDQETFLMAGKTQKGAAITVSGAPIVINPDGTFRQHLKIPGLGLAEVPMRASAAGLAPRFYSMKVKLVQSLAAESKAQEAAGLPGFDAVASKLDDPRGSAVAWRGQVLTASPPGNQSIAVFDVTSGCAKKPCRARIVIPGGPPLSTGDRLVVHGRVVGAAVDRDAKLPDIEVDFFVRQP